MADGWMPIGTAVDGVPAPLKREGEWADARAERITGVWMVEGLPDWWAEGTERGTIGEPTHWRPDPTYGSQSVVMDAAKSVEPIRAFSGPAEEWGARGHADTWEIEMDFGTALTAIKNGGHVARKGWPDGRFVFLDADAQEVALSALEDDGEAVFVPASADLLAMDWRVVP